MIKRFMVIFIVTVTLFTLSLFAISSFADDTSSVPSLTIHSNNLSYADSLHIAYAVSAENLDMSVHPIQMLFWNAPAEVYDITTADYCVKGSSIQSVKGTSVE